MAVPARQENPPVMSTVEKSDVAA
ncbi:MAG: hypothetical protein QOJ68_3046, partial [Blastococcus sp.]|nr:hypothetical protein [Blastococcus sp.]